MAGRAGLVWVVLAAAAVFSLLPCIEASAIYPVEIDAGSLSLGPTVVHKYTFTVTSYGRQNQTVTFRTVTSYLSPYISFEPQEINLTGENPVALFNVTIGASSIASGRHLLIIAADSNTTMPEISGSYNASIMGATTPTGTAAIWFRVPDRGKSSSSEPSSGSVSAGGIPLNKSIEIIAPKIIKTANDSAFFTLRVRNNGEAYLENATLKISSDRPLSISYIESIGSLALTEERAISVRLNNISIDPAKLSIEITASRKIWTENLMVNRIIATIRPLEKATGQEGSWIPAIFEVENMGKANITNLSIIAEVPETWEKKDAIMSMLGPGEKLNRTIFIKSPNNTFGDYLISVRAYEDNILLSAIYLPVSITEWQKKSLIEIFSVPNEVRAFTASESGFDIVVNYTGLSGGSEINLRMENHEACVESYYYDEHLYPDNPKLSLFKVTIKAKSSPAVCNTTIIVWSGDDYDHATVTITTTPRVLSPAVPIAIVLILTLAYLWVVLWRRKKKRDEEEEERARRERYLGRRGKSRRKVSEVELWNQKTRFPGIEEVEEEKKPKPRPKSDRR